MEAATTQNFMPREECADWATKENRLDFQQFARFQETTEQTSSINQWLTSLSILRDGPFPAS